MNKNIPATNCYHTIQTVLFLQVLNKNSIISERLLNRQISYILRFKGVLAKRQ